LGLGTFEYLIGNNPNVVERLNNENWKELHDEYGQVWFTTGLIGLSLFMIFITSTIRKFLKNITEESIALFSSLAAFLVMSVGYFTLRVAPISFYGVILTGLFLQKIGENA
jgi:O-antigen ligase